MLPSIPIERFINPVRGSREHSAICNAESRKTQVWFLAEFGNERYFRAQTPKHDRHVVVIWEDDLSKELQISCDCPAHRLKTEPDACVHTGAVIELAKAAAESGVELSTIQGMSIGDLTCKAT